MKTSTLRNILLIASLLLTLGATSIQAANVTKLDTTTMANGASDWSAAPLSTDIGEFANTPTAPNLAAMTLGGDLTFDGLQLDNNLAGPLTIATGNTLTLGASGINMTAANANATFNCALVLGTAQPWTVASGRTLTIGVNPFNAGANLLTIGGAGNTTFNNAAIINSTGGITKNGRGTLQIVGGANQHTVGSSTITVNGGILNLNNPVTVGITDMMNNSANLALGGGAFTYTYAVNLSQSLASLTINPGESVLYANRNGSFNASLTTVGAVTRNIGGTITARTLDTVRGATTFSGLIQQSLLTNSAGTPFMTVGNLYSGTQVDNFNDWGALDSTRRAIAAPYTTTTATSVGTALQNGNVGVAATTLAAPAVSQSFRDNANQATVIELNGNTWTTGGILVPQAKATAGSIIKDTPGTGSLTGPANSDLVILISANIATPVPYTISARIVDNGTTTITKGAHGTLILSGNNTFTGGVHINSGTIQLGNPGALNSTTLNPINFNGSGMITGVANTSPGSVATAPTLALAGNSISVASISTANNLSGSTPVIKNANGSPVANATLTINNTASTSFTGTIQDGAGGGTLSLLKTGSGTLTLGGTLSYSGSTTVSAGTLILNATPTGTTNIAVTSTLDVTALSSNTLPLSAVQTLDGTGTLNGNVSAVSGATIAPGNGSKSTGGTGILTMNNLTMVGGAIMNFGLNASDPNNSQVSVGAGTLTLPASGTVTLNLFSPGTSTPFAAAGTYNLFKFTTGVNTTSLSSRFTVGTSLTGFIPTFGTAAGPGGTTYLTLTLTVSTGVTATWNQDLDGNWTDATKWSSNPNVPHAAGDAATLGIGSGLRTVALNANEILGTLAMTNANSFVIANNGNTLTFDNSGVGASVSVLDGTANAIQTAVALNDGTVVNVSGGKQLTLSGNIGNTALPQTLTINGAGTTILNTANTYGPAAGSLGTTLGGGGTLQVGNGSALGAGDVSVVGNATLRSGGAGLSIGNNFALGGGVIATLDNNANDLSLGGVISGAGSLIKNNPGTLTLGGANTYSGGTTVNAGTISISSDGASAGNAGNLGVVPASATPNNLILVGSDLLGTSTMTLHANRGIGLGLSTGTVGSTSLIDAASGQTFTIAGNIASAGNTGTNAITFNSGAGNNGTVVLGGANTFKGTTIIANGALQLANPLALQNSILNYSSGQLDFNGVTAATIGQFIGSQNLLLNNLAAAGVNLTIGGNNASWTIGTIFSGLGSLTKAGSGTLTLTNTQTYAGSTTVTGGTLELTNGTINGTSANMNGAGTVLRVNGGSLTASAASTIGVANVSSGTFQLLSGSAAFNGGLTLLNNDGQFVSITGGNFSATSLTINRNQSFLLVPAPTIAAPLVAGTGNGLYVNGPTANVSLGTLTIGIGNSSATARLDAGVVNVTGEVLLGNTSNNRWNILQVNGGTFTSSDTVNGIVISQNNGASLNNSEMYLSGGTTTAEKIAFGVSTDPLGGTGFLIVAGGTLYMGSGGIVQPNVSGYTTTIGLTSGLLGAKADWSSSLPMQLSGANFTIQAADAANVSHNITLSGNLDGPANLLKTGGGVLILSGANSYTGSTTISNGAVRFDNSTGNGIVTVLTNGTVGGSGTISGNVTVNDGGHTLSGGNVGNPAGLTTTTSGSLTYSAGARADFNLSNLYNTGNDKIVVNGSLTGNGAKVGINLTDLITSSLDTTGDYVLFQLNGTFVSGFDPVPVWIGAVPANANRYSVVFYNNSISLRYSPIIISSAAASPNPVAHNQTVNFTVNATAGVNTIDPNTGVYVDASSLGGSPTFYLVRSNTSSLYTNSLVIAGNAALGNRFLAVTVSDNAANQNFSTVLLSVIGATEIWNGAGTPNNTWGLGANWISGVAPAANDFVTFAGSTQTTPNMETAYTVSGLAFAPGAAAFTITNDANVLTLAGGVTNNSGNLQTIAVPLAVNGVQPFNAASNNILVKTVVSDSVGGSGFFKAGTNTLTLAANNNYTGPTLIGGGRLTLLGDNSSATGTLTNSGTLQLAHPNAVAASALTFNNGSTLELRADADTAFNAQSVVMQNASVTMGIDVSPLTAASGVRLTFGTTLVFPNNSSQAINVTGNSSYTLELGAVTLTSTTSHNPYFSFSVNAPAAGPSVVLGSITSGNWGNFVNFKGGGKITVSGNLLNASNGSLDLFVNEGTIVTLLGSTLKTGGGDGYRYSVVNGSLVLDSSTALINNSTTAGLNGSYFILGSVTNIYYGTAILPAAGVLVASNNNFNASAFLGDANNPSGGLALGVTITNYIADGDVGFTNSGVFTVGGQNTSGVNTFNNPIILGWTANRGKSVTLVAATGGEVDFTGKILKNGTDTSAGVTVGDATHLGTVKFTGANTYSGATIVSNGILALALDGVSGLDASISNSTSIFINSGAFLDVTGRSDGRLPLGTAAVSQTLRGNGTLTGNLVVGSLGTVSPGSSIGALNVSGTVTLGGNTLMEINRANVPKSDQLVSTVITAGGTLTVTNIGNTALQPGDTFQLFSTPVSGVFAATNLPVADNGYKYTWNNKVGVDGTIVVLTAVQTVNTNPTNITAVLVGGNTLKLTWPGDHLGWTLQTNSVNLANTNFWFPFSGSSSVTNVNITIDPAKPAVFFRLVYP